MTVASTGLGWILSQSFSYATRPDTSSQTRESPKMVKAVSENLSLIFSLRKRHLCSLVLTGANIVDAWNNSSIKIASTKPVSGKELYCDF